MYLGSIGTGGVVSADLGFVSYPTIALALLSNMDAELAISVAATVGIVGSAIYTFYGSFSSVFVSLGDKAIEKGDVKGIKLAFMYLPPLTTFIYRGGLSIAIVLLGNEYAQTVLDAIPQVVIDIASVLGGLLPAVGVSLLLAYTLKDMKMIAWFFIGVICVGVLGLNLTVISVLGASFAAIYYVIISRIAAVSNSKDDEEVF